MLRDLVYLGIGGALLAKEKTQEHIQELLDKGKVSKEEAQKLLEEAKERGKESEEEFKDELKSIIKEVIDEMGLATKEDINELKEILTRDKESSK